MWAYDIKKQDWTPINIQSLILPPPRSDFAHAKYQNELIIFGGK
jgi:hypothetical protein